MLRFMNRSPDDGLGAGAGVAAGGAAGAAAAGAGAAFDWAGAGIDAGGQTLIQAKGWKSPADAIKGYGELEKLVGGDKIALPGKDAKPEAWDPVWNKLGRPEAADKYQIPKLPQGDYSEVDKLFHAAMLPHAHKAGMTQGQIDALFPALNATATQFAARQAEEWGKRNEAAAASLTADLTRELGGDDKFKAAIETTNGMLRQMFGEDGLGVWNELRLPDGTFLSSHAPTVKALVAFASRLQGDGLLVNGDQAGAGGVAPGAAGAKAEFDRITKAAQADPKHAYADPKHPEHAAMRDKMWRLTLQMNGQA